MLHITKILEYTGHAAAIHCITQDDNGYLYTAGVDKHVIKWQKNEPKNAFVLAKTSEAIYSLHYNNTHNLLFVGTSLGKIHVIDVVNKKEIKLLHNHQKQVFCLKEHRGLLYALNGDGDMSIIHIDTLQTQKIIHYSQQKLRSIDFKNGLIAIACGDSSIKIIDEQNHNIIHQIAAHQNSCNVVKFHPQLNQLISGGWDAHLCVWDNNYKLSSSIAAHNYAIYDICFFAQNNLMATASRDKTIKIWDSSNISLPTTISFESCKSHPFSVNALLYCADDNLLYSVSDDRKIMSWQINNL